MILARPGSWIEKGSMLLNSFNKAIEHRGRCVNIDKEHLPPGGEGSSVLLGRNNMKSWKKKKEGN
jgi:hypothetical protein